MPSPTNADLTTSLVTLNLNASDRNVPGSSNLQSIETAPTSPGRAANSEPLSHPPRNKNKFYSIKGLYLNFDTAHRDTDSVLIRAVRERNIEKIKSLVKSGADLNQANKYGSRALSFAHDIEVIKLLIDLGADVNADADQANKYAFITLLYKAVLGGDIEIVKLLIKSGVNIHQVTGWGETAVMTAALFGHIEIVKLLIDLGADIHHTDKWGFTAFQRAASRGHIEIVKLLLELGVDINRACESGATAVMSAAVSGHLEMVKLLIDLGADIHQKNKFGLAAIHSAAGGGHIEIVKLLLELGVDINQASEDGSTALSAAAENCHVEMVKLLIQLGAHIHQIDKWGSRAFSTAIRKNNLELFQLLIELGADFNEFIQNNDINIYDIIDKDHVEILKKLIMSGFDIKKSGQETSIYYAIKNAKNKISDIVMILIEGGADVNAAPFMGDKPLYAAIGKGYLAIAQQLLDHGAKISKNQRKKNSELLKFCLQKNDKAHAKLLYLHGARAPGYDGDFTQSKAIEASRQSQKSSLPSYAEVMSKPERFKKVPQNQQRTVRLPSYAEVMRARAEKTSLPENELLLANNSDREDQSSIQDIEFPQVPTNPIQRHDSNLQKPERHMDLV